MGSVSLELTLPTNVIFSKQNNLTNFKCLNYCWPLAIALVLNGRNASRWTWIHQSSRLSGNEPLIYPASRCLLFRSEIDDTRASRLQPWTAAQTALIVVAIHIYCDLLWILVFQVMYRAWDALFHHQMKPLSSAEAPAGYPNKNSNNRKIESARGTMGRGKRRERSFPFPLCPARPLFRSLQPPWCFAVFREWRGAVSFCHSDIAENPVFMCGQMPYPKFFVLA